MINVGSPYAEGVWTRQTPKTITFTGGAGLGAVGNVPLFTVTGSVWIAGISAACTASLTSAGAATLALGITGSTPLFVAATGYASITIAGFWTTAGATAVGVAAPAAMKDILIWANIVGTVGTAAVSGGVIRLDVLWFPLSSDGAVVAA